MFVVLKITAVPDHLHGYLSRFLVDYGTGMYVGNVSKRVAAVLWSKTVEASVDGEVVLVTSAPETEQGFQVQLHQARGKEIIDFDGFQLMANIPGKAYEKFT